MQIHEGLATEMPQLSLGTVYRNLEVLVEEGTVDEVVRAGGPARYDANVEPHHHFTCDGCGRIVDVDVPVPPGFVKRLKGAHGLHARRVSISFYGLCSECDEASDSKSATTSTRGSGASRLGPMATNPAVERRRE
jgi:Fe2+ or Zn2+ uptake regulation protein